LKVSALIKPIKPVVSCVISDKEFRYRTLAGSLWVIPEVSSPIIMQVNINLTRILFIIKN
jgi:hypothetical protein